MFMAHKVPDQEVKLILRYYREGETIQRIAMLVKRGTKTVRKVLDNAGIPKKTDRLPTPRAFQPAGGESLGTIGLVGFSQERVGEYVKRYGSERIVVRDRFTHPL